MRTRAGLVVSELTDEPWQNQEPMKKGSRPHYRRWRISNWMCRSAEVKPNSPPIRRSVTHRWTPLMVQESQLYLSESPPLNHPKAMVCILSQIVDLVLIAVYFGASSAQEEGPNWTKCSEECCREKV